MRCANVEAICAAFSFYAQDSYAYFVVANQSSERSPSSGNYLGATIARARLA